MITGSLASSMQGEPRSTHDIDVVVELPPGAVARLTAAFPGPDFLLQEEAIHDALRNHSMFNLLSLVDGPNRYFFPRSRTRSGSSPCQLLLSSGITPSQCGGGV
jgi:hypothetical protein